MQRHYEDITKVDLTLTSLSQVIMNSKWAHKVVISNSPKDSRSSNSNPLGMEAIGSHMDINSHIADWPQAMLVPSR